MFIAKLIPSRMLSLQARKPTGLIGRYVMTRIFNIGNAELNAFVKEMLDLKENDKVLEIGFGPGKLINEMAEIATKGLVEGIDFSETMLKQASRVNRHHIANDRVILHEGECSSLPFGDGYFDKLCSINTIYFWDKPDQYFSEMLRVIKPGGKIVIGFRDNEQMSNLNISKDIFNTYSLDEVLRLLSNAGFSDVHINEKEGGPFLSYCAVAYRA